MPSLSNHTWFGRPVHLVRQGRRTVQRGTVGALRLGSTGAALTVAWREPGTQRIVAKRVSPAVLVCTQTLWLSRDVLSDAEDENPVANAALPKLAVGDDPALATLSRPQLLTLQTALRETNQLTATLYGDRPR